MKFLFIILSTILFGLGCKQSEEKNSVPVPVKEKFASMYPKAENPKWEMEAGKYVASFHQGQKKLKVILTEDGTILKFEEIIDPSVLPQKIKDYVATELAGQNITSAITYTDPKGQNSYEIEVDHRHYVFAKDGQFVGKRNGE